MCKRYLIILLIAMLGMCIKGQSQIVISEVRADSTIEIQNQGLDTVNLDQYWICNRPAYNRIGSLNVICGNFNMPPESFLVIRPNFVLSNSGDELGIFTNQNFGDSTSIVDYLIWGDRMGTTRESVAVAAGIWTLGERASVFGSDVDLLYDGEGTAAADYFLGQASDCEANIATCEAIGGNITTLDGDSNFTICIDDDIFELFEASVTGAVGLNSTWLVTDTLLNIKLSQTSNFIDIESLDSSICLIWHLSSEEGVSGIAVDSNLANLSGCFSLSDSIRVTKLTGNDCPTPSCDADGGSIVNQDSSTISTLCTTDDIEDLVIVSLTGAIGSKSAYLITDTNQVILTIDSNTSVFNLESVDSNVCLVSHLSYEEGIDGLVVGSNTDDLTGCFDLSNAITVNKLSGDNCPMSLCEVTAGQLAIVGGGTMREICVGDGISDAFDVDLVGAQGLNMAWVVSDTNGIIIALPTAPPFELEGQSAGVCLIRNLVFDETLSGLALDADTDDLQGCFAFSNEIRVTRLAGDDCPEPPCNVAGGTIQTTEGTTEATLCVDDDMVELVEATVTGATGPNSLWITADTNGVILKVDTSNIFDLEPAGVGVCLIWHLSFEDTIVGAVVDSNTANLQGCFALSNEIRVTRLAGDDCPEPPCNVAGGTIQTTEGTTEATLCVDDDMVELVEATVTGATGPNSLWITADTNGVILKVDTSNIFDLEPAGAGVCLIWHLSFEDTIVGAVVDSNTANLQGCFALSDSIRVTRLAGDDCPAGPCPAVGGSLTTTDGLTEIVACGGSISSGSFNVNLQGAVGTRTAWVITDTTGVIQGFPLAPPFNLSGARPGILLIWHLSYEGSIVGASLGANINALEGCLALSNPIVVNRTDVSPSTLSLADTSTTIALCVGSGASNPVEVLSTGGSGSQISWVITDTSGVILKVPTAGPFDFETSGPGICQIWKINHASDLAGLVEGANVSDLAGCFVLSNAITVVRRQVNGGVLSTSIGTDVVEICVNDGMSDDVSLSLSGAIGPDRGYILTDTTGRIFQISEELDFDFEQDSLAICQIWHLSHYPDLGGIAEGTMLTDLTGCFDLSNPVTITKLSGDACPPPCDAIGGTLTGIDGGTDITICVDDFLPDNFTLNIDGASGDFGAFIATDTDNNILGIEEEFILNLEGTGAGQILIRYISYDEDANIPEDGGNINTLTGCFALSNIFTINRVVEAGCADVCTVEGGVIEAETEGELIFCADDGEADIVEVLVSGNAGDSSVFVITDAVSNIIELSNTGSFDFEGTGSGSYLIWHLSYRDSLFGLQEGSSTDDLEGCFDISNSITITKSIGNDCPGVCLTDGGMISTIEGDTELVFCAGDVFFTVMHDSNGEDTTATYWYIVTDEDGLIKEWRNSTESADFDLSRDPGGVCRVYGYNTLDESTIAEDIPITDLLDVECGALSENFITITKEVGGACDEGCHVPRDIRVRRLSGTNRWSVRWDRVDDASGFVVLIGYEGSPNSFAEVPVRRNRLNLSGPSNRIIVLSIRSDCRFGETSEFTREIRLVDESVSLRSTQSLNRNSVLQHGTRLPSGIIVSEQAVAFPNPATDAISIWYDGEGVEGNLSIFDQTGRRVMRQRLTGVEELHRVDISDLNNGIYYIMIESQGEIFMQDKLIKTNVR